MKNIIKIKKSEIKDLYESACKDWKDKINQKFPDFVFLDILNVESEFLQEVKQACDSKQLKIFMKDLGKYLPKTLFDEIDSYSDICKKLDEQEINEKQFDSKIFDDNEILIFIAIGRIKQAERLFNGNWKKDWNDSNQYKYFPVFNLKTSHGSVGFICSGYLGYVSCGEVAFYKDQETSDFIGKLMWSEYKKLM